MQCNGTVGRGGAKRREGYLGCNATYVHQRASGSITTTLNQLERMMTLDARRKNQKMQVDVVTSEG